MTIVQTRPVSDHLLEVRNLTTRFDTEEGIVKAVNGISYTLDEGETVGVVGERGCGKSVHALSIMRLIPMRPGTTGHGWHPGSPAAVGRLPAPILRRDAPARHDRHGAFLQPADLDCR